MKITKNQLRRIIREEKEKLARGRLNESHTEGDIKELSSIIDAIDDIANGVYQSDPDLASDLEMQVERLANLHDRMKRSLPNAGVKPGRGYFSE